MKKTILETIKSVKRSSASQKNLVAYYHMKVEVLQTQDESPGDKFECYSHSDDILGDICNAQYHLWKENRWTSEQIKYSSLLYQSSFRRTSYFRNIMENMGFLRSSEQQERHLAVLAVASLSRLMDDSDDKRKKGRKKEAKGDSMCLRCIAV